MFKTIIINDFDLIDDLTSDDIQKVMSFCFTVFTNKIEDIYWSDLSFKRRNQLVFSVYLPIDEKDFESKLPTFEVLVNKFSENDCQFAYYDDTIEEFLGSCIRHQLIGQENYMTIKIDDEVIA